MQNMQTSAMTTTNKLRLRPRAADVILAGCLVACAVAALLLAPAAAAVQAEVYQESRLVAVYHLNNRQELTLTGDYTNVIEITPEGARYLSSNCPDGTCVHTGLVSRPGRTAACVPNRTYVKIVGTGEVDIVAG